ncbi:unnamed protein product [Cylindrotheca closterium]|uniref:Uncharacterized protein n=1 Tax=Cylindrotheca closterium TaxID=2856 RepID=A0AAD2FUT6_9STRA|nr:unnamed protein product [Cylindrotheca closterium]
MSKPPTSVAGLACVVMVTPPMVTWLAWFRAGIVPSGGFRTCGGLVLAREPALVAGCWRVSSRSSERSLRG